MITKRINENQVETDILRFLVNRALTFSIFVLINGHGQVGKSTFLMYLANRIKAIQNGDFRSSRGYLNKYARWDLWDYKKNTTTNPVDFVNRWDSCENDIIALEEAGEQMNYLDWLGIMGRVFSSTSATQGRQRNICFLITPHAIDIMKHNREKVDARIWVTKSIREKRYVNIRPRYIKINYLTDKYKLGWVRDWGIIYPPSFLKEATKFTDWLGTWKDRIVEKNVALAERSRMNPIDRLRFDIREQEPPIETLKDIEFKPIKIKNDL